MNNLLKLQQLMDDIAEWSDKTFGNGDRTIPIAYHLKKEIKELIKALKKGNVESQVDEFSDCFILLFNCASHYGLKAHDIWMFCRRKLEANKTRKWGKPDKNGVVEHIKETLKKCYICGGNTKFKGIDDKGNQKPVCIHCGTFILNNPQPKGDS